MELLPADRSLWTRRDRVVWVSWLALLVLVPITSHPLVARLFGGRPVNPASLVPSLIILGFGILPHLGRGGAVPRAAAILFGFGAVATLSTVVSPWLGFHPLQGAESLERSIRGIATLGIGMSFYLAAALVPRGPSLLRVSLRALSLGAVPALLWSTLQPLQYPATPTRDLMDAIHEALFSQRGLFRDRVTGFAYEPSWFADQLVLLYLPLWLAAVLRRSSAFRNGPGFAYVEAVLLAWGGAMLVLTASRSGYAAWGGVMLGLSVAIGWKAGTRLWHSGSRPSGKTRRFGRPLAGSLGALAGLALVLTAALLTVQIATRLDRRMAKLLDLDFSGREGSGLPAWFTIATQLEYAERVVYWTSAARVFSLHPVLGVGLGNSGFLFPRLTPALGYELIDVLRAVGVAPGSFPNPKSLWFRIPAETGLIGSALFLTWLTVSVVCAWDLARRGPGPAGVVGLAAVLGLAAFLVEGFSLDTFALPHPWMLLGMTGGLWSRLALREEAT